MPFKSLAQERFMYSQKPKLANEWQDKYGIPKQLPQKVAPKAPVSPWEKMLTSKSAMGLK